MGLLISGSAVATTVPQMMSMDLNMVPKRALISTQVRKSSRCNLRSFVAEVMPCSLEGQKHHCVRSGQNRGSSKEQPKLSQQLLKFIPGEPTPQTVGAQVTVAALGCC